jgi:hypothetical protein
MDKALILKRIKEEKNFKTDAQLAVFLGISKAVLSNWYKRDTIDYDLVLSKCELMDLNWIIRGEKSENIKEPESGKESGINLNYYLMRFEALIRENEAYIKDKEYHNVVIACLESEKEELEKELQHLKTSRGKHTNTPPYSLIENVSSQLAAEPRAHKHTR